MTENHERAEQARFVFHIYGCNVQIVPNATHAIQIIHQGDGTILRTESCITPAASGRHESQAPNGCPSPTCLPTPNSTSSW